MSKKQEKMEPVYFMDLVVENVRCFKDRQVMDLSDGNGKPARWTIILGDNGTGKTTLLKCLALLNATGFTDEKQEIKGVYPYLITTPITSDFFASNINSEFQLYTKNLFRGSFLGKSTILIGKYGYSGTENEGQVFTPTFHENDLFIIPFSANRKSGNGSLSDTKSKNPISSFIKDNSNIINAEAWLLETDFAIKSAQNSTKKYLQNRYTKVKETLKKLLPDVQDFQVKEITKTNIQAAIEVQTPYGWVDMKNLSLGYQTFIAWVVDLSARLFDRYPDSDNPLEEPCIVLVDEIDLHLHPKWQRKIISFLTDIFKNAQFIVTAHSPLIVQAAEDANIVLLKREGDSVKIYNNMDEHIIDDWRFDQILTSELFGLHSARSPKYDAYIERKKEILEKDKLTKKDEKELEQIAEKLEEIPLDDKQANDAIEALKKATAILNAQ